MRREKLFRNIDLGLYASLIFLGLLPAIYMAVRTNLLGQFPGDYSYSIAGHLSWVNLLYEVVNEAVILPLFCFLAVKDRKEFENRLRTGLLISAVIYTVLAEWKHFSRHLKGRVSCQRNDESTLSEGWTHTNKKQTRGSTF